MSSLFGDYFKVMTFGESHGAMVGCVVDGCPAGVSLPLEAVARFLRRRRPGQSDFTSPRKEGDVPRIVSGVEQEVTLGTPICILVENENQRSADYQDMAQIFRPSHADYTYQQKYGIRAVAGGGRASARETIGRVAAAAVAQQALLAKFPQLEVVGFVKSVGDLEIPPSLDQSHVTLEQVENSPVRCPDPSTSLAMEQRILEVKQAGDTLGGQVGCVVRHCPVGWGEPVFDKLEALLGRACLSLPASKSFELGSGLAGTKMLGSQHNDVFYTTAQGEVLTKTNHSGGVQGGISNGMPLEIRVGFKPVATLFKPQETITKQGENVLFAPNAGRHDSCVLPRAVPMVEAMVWLVLMDLYLASLGNRW
jgi:chorismate synthase